jgi:hypothetical protein
MDKNKNKIDKTKENIGVGKLDEGTRKKLFEKFVEGGGKIVVDKEVRRHLVIDRDKQKQFLKQVDRHPNVRVKKEPAGADEKKKARSLKAAPQASPGSFSLFWGRMKLRFKLRFYGVAGMGGYLFNNRFFKKFNNQYKPALMEIQILYLEMFRKNPAVGRNLTAKLDEIKPLYYELIEMTGNLFDKITADQILDQYMNFPQVPKKTLELKEQLMGLYRKLHILNSFENSIAAAFEQAIDLYMRVEENTVDSQHSMRRRLRNALFIVFHKFFPRLHLLFCLYQGRYVTVFDTAIDEILGIGETEKPGNRQISKYFDEAAVSVEAAEKQEGSEGDKEIDDDRMKLMRRGLELMAYLDMTKLRKEYDRERLFENVSDADKVFLTYLLFKEFDREYSFILTTNKIKFRTDFVARTKVDFKSKLIGLYDKMRKSTDTLKEYSEELATYEKTRHEKPSGSSKYIEFTKRMESLEQKKNAAGKNALSSVREYMLEVVQELQELMDDMDGNQIYIENPQEELSFDPLIEGDKKLNGKKIFEAISTVYCYAMAFAYRLSQGGDLSGELLFNKEELEQLQQLTKEKDQTMQDKSGTGGKDEKSVLEELDDMV